MSNLKSYREKYPSLTEKLKDEDILQTLHQSYFEDEDYETFKNRMLSDEPLTPEEDEEEIPIEAEEEAVVEVEKDKLPEEELLQKSQWDDLGERLENLKKDNKFIGTLDYILETPDRIRDAVNTTGMGALSDIGQETLQLVNGLADYTGLYEFDAELNDKQQKVVKTILSNLVKDRDNVTTKMRGRKEVATIKEPEYFGGEIIRDLSAIIGSIFVGTKGIGAIANQGAKTKQGAELLKKLEGREKTLKGLKYAKYSAGADVGIQVSIDPYEARFANMIGESIQDDEGAMATIVDFLEADPDDTEMEARAGLFFETFALNLALPVAWYGGKKVVNKAKDSETIIKNLKKIKEKGGQAVSDFKSLLTNGSKNSGEKAPKLKKPRGKVGEDATSEWQYSPTAWKRFLGTMKIGDSALGGKELFKSRGYFTPAMFDMFRKTEASKAAWFQRADDLATNLDTKITKIAKKSNRYKNKEELSDLVQNAFTSRTKKSLNAVPASLRKDIEEARDIVDSFSAQLLKLPYRTVSKEAQKSIDQNMGEWFRRSYRLFEEEKWKPSEEIISNAEKYMYNYLRRNFKKYKAMTPDDLRAKVRGDIDILINQTGKSGDIFARADAVGGLNKSLLSRKSDLAKPIRDLLGEVKDPSANLLISLNRISSFVENNKFLDDAWQLGRGKLDGKGAVRGGYIFEKPVVDSVTGIKYTTQLKDPSLGILNRKYVTPELAMMFGQRKILSNQLMKSNAYKYFLAAKGYGQASKTVFNHITHLRNTLGGVFFTLANGRMPLGKEGQKSWDVIKNKLGEKGNKKHQAYYQRLRELDIVDNSAKFGDIQALMKEADLGVESFLDKRAAKLGWEKGFGKAKKYINKVQETYIAEDDFFKIMNFEKELGTLKQAYKKELRNKTITLQSLEEEAAAIIRNTIPNYSLVPTGIKELRKLPFGNYFSFPAEMVRTSYHITKQAIKEMGSSNALIRERGIKRGAGFGVVGLGGAEGLSELTKAIAQVTDNEEEALRNLSPFDFQKNSKMLYWRNEEGKLFSNDFSYVDPYDFVKRPAMTFLQEFAVGERKQQDVSESLANAMVASLEEGFRPFFSESLLTERALDVSIRQGRTKEGYRIPGWIENPKGDQKFNNFWRGLVYSLQTFAPGAFAAIPKLYKGATGKEKDWLNTLTASVPGDREYNLKAEVLANFTGIRWTPVDIEKQLRQQTRKYKNEVANINVRFKDAGIGRGKNGDDFVNAYRDANEETYKNWKNIALAFEAAEVLDVNPITKENALTNAGFSTQDLRFLRTNRFRPFQPSDQAYEDYELKNQKDNMSLFDLQRKIDSYHNWFLSMPIIDFDKSTASYGVQGLEGMSLEELEDEQNRQQNVTGGLIEGSEEVPFTQEKPEDRINPFTGEPYTDAYYNSSNDRRVGLSEGGRVSREKEYKEKLQDLEDFISKNRLVSKEAQMNQMMGEGYRDPRFIATTGNELIDRYGLRPLAPEGSGQVLYDKQLGLQVSSNKDVSVIDTDTSVSAETLGTYSPSSDKLKYQSMTYDLGRTDSTPEETQVHEIIHRADERSGYKDQRAKRLRAQLPKELKAYSHHTFSPLTEEILAHGLQHKLAGGNFNDKKLTDQIKFRIGRYKRNFKNPKQVEKELLQAMPIIVEDFENYLIELEAN